jgi:hypothetical protein
LLLDKDRKLISDDDRQFEKLLEKLFAQAPH